MVSYADLVREWGPVAAGMRDDLPNVQQAYPGVPMQPLARGVDIPQLGEEHRYSEYLGGYANQPWHSAAIDPDGIARDLQYTIPDTGKSGTIPLGTAFIPGQATPSNVGHEILHLNPAFAQDNDKQHNVIETLRKYDRGVYGSNAPETEELAGMEHELGARLMYDPSRGHNAAQVAKSALADPTGGKDNYIKFRNMQPGFADILRRGQ